MKNIIISALVMSLAVTSCNKKNNVQEDKSLETKSVVQSKAIPNNENSPKQEAVNQKANDYIEDILTGYINLKNMLAKDDTNGAAEKGKILFASFNKFDASALNAKQKKEYLDIADDAKEHAEHIGLNGGNIPHQREHFASLSKDISDLITLLGSNQKLYQDYCPMYDNGKGAVWISKTKEIENPYFGKKMSTCGSIKKEF